MFPYRRVRPRGFPVIRRTALKPRNSRPRARRRGARRGRIIDRPYLAWCSTQPCCISHELPATTHHVREYGSPKSDRRVIRLAPRFHLHEAGPLSIERLSKSGFERTHSIRIEAEIRKLWKLWLAAKAGRISGAAELILAADVDLFALDTRDFSDDGTQPDPFEWTEE
jgi:hypothetical protein